MQSEYCGTALCLSDYGFWGTAQGLQIYYYCCCYCLFGSLQAWVHRVVHGMT